MSYKQIRRSPYDVERLADAAKDGAGFYDELGFFIKERAESCQ